VPQIPTLTPISLLLLLLDTTTMHSCLKPTRVSRMTLHPMKASKIKWLHNPNIARPQAHQQPREQESMSHHVVFFDHADSANGHHAQSFAHHLRARPRPTKALPWNRHPVCTQTSKIIRLLFRRRYRTPLILNWWLVPSALSVWILYTLNLPPTSRAIIESNRVKLSL
jgi:hypothetical protein